MESIDASRQYYFVTCCNIVGNAVTHLTRFYKLLAEGVELSDKKREEYISKHGNQAYQDYIDKRLSSIEVEIEFQKKIATKRARHIGLALYFQPDPRGPHVYYSSLDKEEELKKGYAHFDYLTHESVNQMNSVLSWKNTAKRLGYELEVDPNK